MNADVVRYDNATLHREVPSLMIGTIGFCRLPGSLTAGEHPVLSSRTSVESSYRVNTVSSAKFTKDFQQRIVVAEFDDWTTCNMVRLSSGSWIGWYWITDRSQSSIASGGVEFAVEFAPITSMLEVGDELAGYWTRAPTNISPWKGQAVMSGAMQVSRTQDIGVETITDGGTTYTLMWVSVTITGTLSDASGTGLNTYGFPIAVAPGWNGGIVKSLFLTDSEAGCDYPKVDNFIHDPTAFGIEASRIQDISVSSMIPYAYTRTAKDIIITNGVIETYTDATGDKIGYVGIVTKEVREVSGTLRLSSMENDCGSVGVRDNGGSMVFSVPTAWTSKSGSYYDIPYTYSVFVDIGQMYGRLQIGGQIVQVPCGHLPYTGSQWDNYKAYSQAFDRESMQYSIDSARESLNIQTNAQITNAALSAVGSALKGDIGGVLSTAAGTGISVATSYRMQDISDRQSRFAQDLTERRIQAQPATAYSVGYGLSYILNCTKTPLCLAVSMPAGLTSSIYSNFVSRYGYSVEGFDALTVGTGFYQGNLMPSETMCGGEFDRLNEVLNTGVYLVEI